MASAKDLEPRLVVLEQQRQRARVRVVVDAEVTAAGRRDAFRARRLWTRRVVVEPQEARVSRAEGAREGVGGHPEVRGDGGQEAGSQPLARGRERAHDRTECRPLAGPRRGGAASVLRAAVEDLLPVARVLRQLPVVEAPGISGRPLEASLRIEREREESAHLALERVEDAVVDPVPDHLEEAPVATGLLDDPERLRIGEAGRVDDGDRARIGHVGSSSRLSSPSGDGANRAADRRRRSWSTAGSRRRSSRAGDACFRRRTRRRDPCSPPRARPR